MHFDYTLFSNGLIMLLALFFPTEQVGVNNSHLVRETQRSDNQCLIKRQLLCHVCFVICANSAAEDLKQVW